MHKQSYNSLLNAVKKHICGLLNVTVGNQSRVLIPDNIDKTAIYVISSLSVLVIAPAIDEVALNKSTTLGLKYHSAVVTTGHKMPFTIIETSATTTDFHAVWLDNIIFGTDDQMLHTNNTDLFNETKDKWIS